MKKLANWLLELANSPRGLLGVFAGIILTSGIIYANVEDGKTFFDGLWWSLVTASTVGYGDQYPNSLIGRGLASIVIYSMLFLLVPLITAQYAAKFIVDRDQWSHEEQEDLKASIRELIERLDRVEKGENGLDEELDDLREMESADDSRLSAMETTLSEVLRLLEGLLSNQKPQPAPEQAH